jgi:hypothetical protein
VRKQHSEDSFFRTFESSLKTWPLKRRFYAAYERAFALLDDSSWKNLLSKAVNHFPEKRYRQVKGPFFDQLNDALAYQWLVSRGFTEVSVLPEPRDAKQGSKCPDISFCASGNQFYCDVKTLSTSIAELDQRCSSKYRDSSRYAQLHPTFLKKIDDAVSTGTEQIRARGPNGMVFVLVNFDDFTLTYYSRHRTQIASHLRDRVSLPIVIKFGVCGHRRIQRVRSLLRPGAA